MNKFIRKTLVCTLLVCWAASMPVICASLMVGHWVPLPTPKVGEVLAPLAATRTFDSAPWKAMHFLYSDCPCSRRVLKHILQREPVSDVEEVIVLIGEPNAIHEVSSSGRFALDCVTPSELKSKYNVEAAPLLVVLDPEQTIRYSGAYTSRKQGFEIQDVSLITRTIAGELLAPLPLYGCGVSRELNAIIDPLGLK